MIHCENCLHFTEDIICEHLGWCDITNIPKESKGFCDQAEPKESEITK